MFECTVTVGDEEQSSYYGMSLPHAMELALFRHAYLPWCKSSTLNEDTLEGEDDGFARQVDRRLNQRAIIEEAIVQVRAAVARRQRNAAVTGSRTNPITAALLNFWTTIWRGRAA